MRILSYITCLFIAAALFTGCTKDKEVLTPTEEVVFNYQVPQGNNDYDQRIVGYFNRYGTNLLYKFRPVDFTWQGFVHTDRYNALPADPEYVNKQLDLIQGTFFKYYQDSTLRRCLPLKFFLCSSLRWSTLTPQVDAFLLSSVDMGGSESFAVNWGSKRILNINGVKDSTVIFRGNINFSFLKMMDIKLKMGQSQPFLAITDYTTTPLPSTQATRYQRGSLKTTSTFSKTPDWYDYIQTIVSNPYSLMIDPATTAADVTAKGILTPVKDTNGLIRRKYTEIIKFYKDTYNIDLQKIGNGE
jgi:hypothetical protein